MDISSNKKQWYHIIPISVLVCFVPLVVYLKIIELSGPSYDFWNGQKENLDFFSYNKMVWLIALTVVAVLIFIYELFGDSVKIKRTWLYVPMTGYAIMVFLSAICSKYPSIAKAGFVDRYEGMYVLLCYMIILFLTINMLVNENNYKILLGFLIFSATIMGIIGVFQFIGFDFFKSSFGKNIILPAENKAIANTLKFQFGKNTIYSTLYHYNYVGSYMSMLFPLTLIVSIFSKKKANKIAFALISLLMLFNLIGSNSRAGVFGGAVAIIFLIILARKKFFKNWKWTLSIIAVLVIIVLAVNQLSGNKIRARMGVLLTDVMSIFHGSKQVVSEPDIPLKDIKLDGNKAEIITKTETLRFETDGKQIFFKDESDNPINAQSGNGKITLLNDKYKTYEIAFIKINNLTVMMITKPGNLPKDTIKLFLSIESPIKLVTPTGRYINTDPIEKWGFEGKESFASARGYIWSRSLPLLKDTMILGHGADTFAVYFPQNEFKVKMDIYLDGMWTLVDKPHNFYLQNALNNGVVSLGCLLVIFIGYICNCFKLLWKSDFNDIYSVVALGAMIAVIGYLGTSTMNDSVVSVAPVFWVILGIGISVNHKLSQVSN